ncbi:MAG: flagellar protein FlaG [Ignavibacteriae bacterium]|nr:flagellar protein FlaG [Ignavibacteriota bacterium]
MSLVNLTPEPTQPASFFQPAAARPAAQQPEKTAAPPKEEATQKQQQVSQKDIEKVVNEINENLQAMHTELNFSVDKETDTMVLKIVNSKTQEVIRQIPAEDALRIASRLTKLLGILVDENA